MRKKIEFFLRLPTGLKAMIGSAFLVAFGSFMVTPFLGIYLKQSVDMNFEMIGTILALGTFIQFGGGVLGGAIAESFGLKQTMIGSLILRTAGFLLLAASVNSPVLVVPAILIGAFGPALYLPANRAYIVSCVTSNEKPLFLSISNASMNAGMAIGPLIAALLIIQDPSLLFILVAILFSIIILIHQVTLPTVAEHDSARRFYEFRTKLPEALIKVWRPLLVNVLIFYCYFYFQNFMGIYASGVVGVKFFSLLTLLNFTTMVFIQPILAKWIASTNYKIGMTSAFVSLGMGMVIMGIGSHTALFLGTFVMTLGQCFLFLRGDLELVNLLPDMPAMAFGVQRLAMGVGGLFSGIIGGKIYRIVEANPGNFWQIAGLQCAIAGFFIPILFSKKIEAMFLTPKMAKELHIEPN